MGFLLNSLLLFAEHLKNMMFYRVKRSCLQSKNDFHLLLIMTTQMKNWVRCLI